MDFECFPVSEKEGEKLDSVVAMLGRYRFDYQPALLDPFRDDILAFFRKDPKKRYELFSRQGGDGWMHNVRKKQGGDRPPIWYVSACIGKDRPGDFGYPVPSAAVPQLFLYMVNRQNNKLDLWDCCLDGNLPRFSFSPQGAFYFSAGAAKEGNKAGPGSCRAGIYYGRKECLLLPEGYSR